MAVALLCLCAALAAWLSGGALAIANESGLPRLGLLPPLAWLVVAVGIAILAIVTLRYLRDRFAILAITLFLALPWLPFEVPRAFLVWTGPLRIVVWTTVAMFLAAPLVRHALPRDPLRAPWIAALLAAVCYLAAAWQLSPRIPSGDEPHYLVIAQSLLRDGDLAIENNHRRGDYREYWGGTLRPDYLNRGADGQIYSIHAPGLPALVAPAFGLFGYPGVAALLALLTASASALVWRAAWAVTADAAASWFAWAGVALSAPVLFQSFLIYPDALGAALILAGAWPLVAGVRESVRRLAAAGAAIAVLPWLHTRLSLAAAVLTVLVLVRIIQAGRLRAHLAAFATLPVLSALAWLGFFYAIYGTPDPRAPYGGTSQTSLTGLPAGLVGLSFDQQFGLLANAPVFACAAFGFVPLFRRDRRLAMELLLVAVPYGLAVAAFQLWWGGLSSPARFLVPMLLVLAVPLATSFAASTSRTARLTALGALALSLLISAALAAIDRGALVYNVRDGASRLLLWASPFVDLTTALPSVFRTPPSTAFVHGAIWCAAAAAVVGVGGLLERRSTSTRTIAAALAMAAGLSGMLAASVVWRANGATPLTPFPAGAAMLGRLEPARNQVVLRYSPLERLTAPDALSRVALPIEAPGRAANRIRRYGPSVVIWVDGTAYLERPGAWIPGGSGATFVIEPQAGSAPRLVVRNAPVENIVDVRIDLREERVNLRPGDERFFDLPAQRSLLRITASAGARPSEFEPGSKDRRFLGCWIEIR